MTDRPCASGPIDLQAWSLPEPLNSAQNPRVQLLMGLAHEARARRAADSIWVEGLRLCESALAACGPGRPWRLQTLVLSTDASAAEPDRLHRFLSQALACAAEVRVLSPKVFARVSQVDGPQGLAMVLSRSSQGMSSTGRTEPSAVMGSSPDPMQQDRLLIDRVQDPGNLGSLMRTAAAAGIAQVWLLSGSAEAHSPKALRAGMGAQFGLEILEDLGLEDCLERIRSEQLRAVLTVAPGALGAEDLFRSTALSQSAGLVWCLGQEGSGLSPALMALPNALKLSIPQAPQVESLNVAAAAAVCLFERRRRRLASADPL